MPRYLYTSALPYANGSIHLGHLVETILTDIHVRAMRLLGEDVLYVCADDAHGTPIEMNALKQGITPEELVARSYAEHTRDFASFDIHFDAYHTTDSPENRAHAERIFAALRDGGHIERRTTLQFYSESLGRFLPDRMVRGTCPNCGAPDQYGDACEVCRATYEPTELKDPVDAIEGRTPVLRETEQLYVRIASFQSFLEGWLPEGLPQESMRRFVEAWITRGLESWCISRDAPYFGFPIPGEPGKFFYVWLDAPIGYIAATEHWANQNGQRWQDWWSRDADVRITHVIGKDIVYFHTLFWPAMLEAAGLKTPDRVQVHGFLTVDGKKMSKSRGTFIRAATWAEHLSPDYLRYYYAAKLSDGIEDIDLNPTDFIHRTNAELINNVVNLCSRTTKMLLKSFDGATVGFDPGDFPVLETVHDHFHIALDAFRRWDLRHGIRAIVEAGDALNLFMQESEPWKVVRDDPEQAQRLCSVVLHGCIVLWTALSPVVPRTANAFARTLGLDAFTHDHATSGWLPDRVLEPATLLPRLELSALETIMEASKEDLAAASTTPALTSDDVVEVENFAPPITFDDFAKVDLRVGVIQEAHLVDGADKLLRLIVHCGRSIQVFAGIRKAYPDPSVLVGRRAIVVANLQPRKMRFGMSEGMLLATSDADDTGLQLALLDPSTKGGWTVR